MVWTYPKCDEYHNQPSRDKRQMRDTPSYRRVTVPREDGRSTDQTTRASQPGRVTVAIKK
eukprot:1193164-Prorocentrum_minimum.AAC.2